MARLVTLWVLKITFLSVLLSFQFLGTFPHQVGLKSKSTMLPKLRRVLAAGGSSELVGVLLRDAFQLIRGLILAVEAAYRFK